MISDSQFDLVDQIARELTDCYMAMLAEERDESERNAAEAAPSPFKFNIFVGVS